MALYQTNLSYRHEEKWLPRKNSNLAALESQTWKAAGAANSIRLARCELLADKPRITSTAGLMVAAAEARFPPRAFKSYFWINLDRLLGNEELCNDLVISRLNVSFGWVNQW